MKASHVPQEIALRMKGMQPQAVQNALTGTPVPDETGPIWPVFEVWLMWVHRWF